MKQNISSILGYATRRMEWSIICSLKDRWEVIRRWSSQTHCLSEVGTYLLWNNFQFHIVVMIGVGCQTDISFHHLRYRACGNLYFYRSVLFLKIHQQELDVAIAVVLMLQDPLERTKKFILTLTQATGLNFKMVWQFSTYRDVYVGCGKLPKHNFL